MIQVGDRVWRRESLALPQPLSTREKDIVIVVVVAAVALAVYLVVSGTGPLRLMTSIVAPLVTLLAGGGRYLVRAWRSRRWSAGRARAPGRPWEWDAAWSGGLIEIVEPVGPRQIREGRNDSPNLMSMLGTLAVALLLAYLLWSRLGPGRRVWVVAGLLAVVAFLAHAFMRQRDVWSARLDVSTFPIRPGRPFEAQFGLDAEGGHFEELRLVFRCMQERSHGFRGLPSEIVYLQTVEIEPHRIPEPGADVVIPIELPPSAPGTDLTQRCARYWELVVEGAGAFGGFQRTFLLPVYRVAEPPAAVDR